jgi:hypothetical protein
MMRRTTCVWIPYWYQSHEVVFDTVARGHPPYTAPELVSDFDVYVAAAVYDCYSFPGFAYTLSEVAQMESFAKSYTVKIESLIS